jgi:phosphoglycolate phosphatase
MVERAIEFSSENLPSLEQLEKAVIIFERHYQTFLNCESGLYQNVAQTIKALSEKGYKIALVTNKAERFLPDLLSLYEINDYFDLLLGGDTLVKNKPDPIMVNYACDYFNVEKQHTVMIGDSRNDILAGQNAGVTCIALTYGYNYGNPVSELNPDYIIDHFDQLLDLL